MDYILEGSFMTYGYDVISSNLEPTTISPMSMMFPKMARCRMFRYDVNGAFRTVEALCHLPLNMINDKIFLFFWIWFLMLAIVTLSHVIYSINVMLSPSLRELIMKNKMKKNMANKVHSVCHNYNFGDWFVMDKISQNLDEVIFEDFINALYYYNLDSHSTLSFYNKKQN
jgi:hypothetical protein